MLEVIIQYHWDTVTQQTFDRTSVVPLKVDCNRCLWHQAPWYLADYCVPVSEVPGRQHLRSARCHQLSVPRFQCSTFVTRAFSISRPTVWNSLPDHLCDSAVDSEQLCRTRRRICLPDIQSVSATDLYKFSSRCRTCNSCGIISCSHG